MLNPIYTEETECQDCYKCVRHCPVKTIEVVNGHAKIMTEDCILCGSCVRVCPVGAKKIRNDLPRARKLISRGEKTILSLAPSFAGEFRDISRSQLIRAIKLLGFYGVSETALGAEEVSRHTVNMLSTSKQPGPKISISSACPTIVEYIRKYRPELNSFLYEILSPLQAHCKMLKQYYGDDIKIVFAGPCIAKKREADLRPDLVSLAISFDDLKLWFDERGIDLSSLESNTGDCFIPASSRSGALYPLEGGMINSFKMIPGYMDDLKTISFSGIHRMEEFLEGLENLCPEQPVFLELLACQGGCINGPATERGVGSAVKNYLVSDYAEKLSENRETTNLKHGDLEYRRKINPVLSQQFREDEIIEALKKIGKYGPEDEKNCGACGYMTCRDYAKAYLEKRAEKDMCVSYLKKLSEKKANALINTMPAGVVIVDHDLKIIECNSAFAAIIGKETEELFNIRPGMRGVLLEKIFPFEAVFRGILESEDNTVHQTFHIGEKILDGSIFSIEKNQAVGGIFQDVTSPQVQKERIIRQAKAVMEKNVESIQQIAYLLGENAAESEVMLNTIIESFSADNGV